MWFCALPRPGGEVRKEDLGRGGAGGAEAGGGKNANLGSAGTAHSAPARNLTLSLQLKPQLRSSAFQKSTFGSIGPGTTKNYPFVLLFLKKKKSLLNEQYPLLETRPG